MDWIVLLGRLLLAIVFLVAAVGKLIDRQGSRTALADFGLPSWMAAPAAVVLPVAELVVAVLLLLGATARWGALAALGLLGLFIAAMAISLARGRRPDCHCFGQLHSAPVGWPTLSRNGFLAVLAGLVLWRGGEGARIGSTFAGAGAGASTWIALGVALLALAIATAEAWFLLNLLQQQGRVLGRLKAAEAALGIAPVAGIPVGEQAPEFELRGLGHDRVSLSALRSSGRPVLLVFTNPYCMPCDELLPDIARWQKGHADRVTIAVISRGPVESNRAKAEAHGLRTVLLQKGREVVEAYQVDSTPAAVLVSAAGTIASPIGYGADRIAELVEQAAFGLKPAPRELVPSGTGNGNGRRSPVEPRTLVVGEPAPTLALPDLEGRTITLGELQGSPTLVLFWSPTCGFCQKMLPDLKKWERKRPAGAPRILVVSTGTAEANRAMGLASPIMLDSDGSAMHRFGANGTPMAVLVDASGKIASPVVAGAQNVMALAGAREDVSARR
jgi:methylamine dehydrogenase accessory protein MauD